MPTLSRLCLAVALSLAGTHLEAAPGDLDTSFGGSGKITLSISAGQDNAREVIQQADKKLVVIGSRDNNDFALARYNIDGSLDSTFGGTGIVTTDLGGFDSAVSAIQQSDGKLVAAGAATDAGNSRQFFALARYNNDGSLDTTFGIGGKVITAIGTDRDFGRSVIQQADGKLVVAGSTNFSNNDFAIVRYNSDGSLDTGFNGSGIKTISFGPNNDPAYAIIQQEDGKLVVGGTTIVGVGNGDFALARLNSDGSLDTTFDSDGKVTTAIGTGHDQASSLIQQADGKLVLVGNSDFGTNSANYNNGINVYFALARYNANGSLDSDFDSDGKALTAVHVGTFNVISSKAYSVKQQADGKLVVAGTDYNGFNQDFALVRYNGDGSLDSGFNSNGKVITAIGSSNDNASSVIQQADGKLVVAGSSFNGSYDFALARYESGQIDTDADGSIDGLDAFPTDPAEQLDSDNDGIGNNADPDDDDDGIPDGIDPETNWLPLTIDSNYKGSALRESTQ